MIKDILMALAVMGSFWLGQVLYLWAREEVDAFRKRIAEQKTRAERSSAGEKSWIFQLRNSQRISDGHSRNEISASEKDFSKLIPWYHSALYAGVLGFAQAIAPRFENFEIISLVLMMIGLILWSVVYADKDKVKSLKGLLVSSAVFLAVFGVVYGLFYYLVR
ncbi:MAG: hypothetical protein V1839_03480 [archaeon]